jgi:hypothetical protein
MENNTGFCAHCDSSALVSELTDIDGLLYCESCNDNYIGNCTCGRALFDEENFGSNSLMVCETCYDNFYSTCSECDAVIHNDNACYLESDDDRCFCDHCYSERVSDDDDEAYIYNYTYKPKPIFFGKGERYFGIELEIDKGGKSETNAKALLDIANCHDQELIYIKGDSSLDNGMEIVTHPMSYEFNKTQMPWREILNKCISLGYKSHQTSTAGLHVHISRAGLGCKFEDQEQAIGRIIYFFEKHFDELLVFSRRTLISYQRWCSRYGLKDSPKEVLDQAKKSYGRYTCVNLMNNATIEIRIFRGTLKLNSLIASLELTNAICDQCLTMNDEEIQNQSWQSFVMSIDKDKNPELIEYLKAKRLYVNDEIETEEDI